MATATEARPGSSRRILRALFGTALAAGFTAGIVVLMMVLSGAFERKVPTAPDGGAARHKTSEARPAPGERATVRMVRRPRRESAVGTIRPIYEAIVASKILARVEEVRAHAGQEVRRGDVLVLLDKADLKAKMDQARSAEAAARARFEQAEIDQGRIARLRAREAVTQSELDQSNTALRTARAELQRARQAVEEAQVMEAYATVKAPISGRVIDKKVNAGDTVSPGQVLVTIYDPTHMQMIATVRESLALRLKPGQEIPSRIDSLGYECLATVSEIVPEAQAESRSFQVKLTGPCPPNVYSGMFGRVFIPLEDEDVLIVPPGAVRRIGQLDEVDVDEGGQVSRRAVQLGRVLDEGIEVLSGLSAGEKVVLHAGAREESRGDRS